MRFAFFFYIHILHSIPNFGIGLYKYRTVIYTAYKVGEETFHQFSQLSIFNCPNCPNTPNAMIRTFHNMLGVCNPQQWPTLNSQPPVCPGFYLINLYYCIWHQLWNCNCPICVSGANLLTWACHSVICSEQSTCHPYILLHYCPEIQTQCVKCFGPAKKVVVSKLHTQKLVCLLPQTFLQIAADKRVEHHLPCTWSERVDVDRGRERGKR